MFMTNSIRRAQSLTCITTLLVMSATTYAEPPVAISKGKAEVIDVALGKQGTLIGIVKDIAGKAKSHALVSVGYAGKEVAAVETLDDGSFVVEGLREGTHVIQASGRKSAFRFWESDKAPPGATPKITLVARQVPADEGVVPFIPEPQPAPLVPVQRGYSPRRGFLGRAFANYPLLTSAGLLGAGIGSGIAIGSGINDEPASP